MTNSKLATLLSISELSEEDITLSIEETTVNCFLNSCRHELKIGKTYNIELSLELSDSYEIWKSRETDLLVEKIGHGYAYYLYGELNDSVFISFIDFHDEDIHYNHPELNNHFIKLKAERINANLL